MLKKILLSAVCVFHLSLHNICAEEVSAIRTPQEVSDWLQKNQILDATPYILPKNHRLRPILDSLFSSREVIKNADTLKKAGFITLVNQKVSGIRLIRHPRLQGYVIKLYLDSQAKHRRSYSQQDWLIQRCRGAARLRELITTRHFDHFIVPDKWLYEVPPKEGDPDTHTYVLVATYMHLVSKDETRQAWKTKVTQKDLRDLFILMESGGASGALVINTPYTKEGKFAFVDTEYPDRIFNFRRLFNVRRYFSSQNQAYWLSLIQEMKTSHP